MSSSFERTFSALRESRSRWPNAAIACGLVTLALWVIWAGFSEVAVYKSSQKARLEPMLAPTRVATVVSGRITVAYLKIGSRVNEKDILLQLDPTQEQILADKARARIQTLIPQVESLARELALEADAVVQGGSSEVSTEGELRAHLRAAQADVSAAERDLAREIDAVNAGVSPLVAREKAENTVAQKRATAEAIQHQLDALVANHREHGDSRRVHAEQLERQHTELANQLAAARSELAQHEATIELHTIRAPVSGFLGEVNQLRPGAVIHEGDVIATVVPEGALHVVADYGPEALGRLRPGQPARVRLEGFPWTHYGTLVATVASVGSELRDNAIRVELDLAPQHEFVLSNGMTGAVDIEVDRVSPFGLFSRMLGEQSR
ncbi:MAG TPA: HlyD family efflux transporter periplasmic adaptor subunit [Kofleriaceae bacterium]|nr:HlyD family efflux transporter periplasmic adaptor subunit [Kofleriaceae bacterium]